MTEIRQAVEQLANRYTKITIKEDVLSQMAALGELVEFAANDLIVAAGDDENKLYLLIDGLIRKYYLDYQGNDLTHQFLESGQVFSTQHVVFSGQVICNFEAL